MLRPTDDVGSGVRASDLNADSPEMASGYAEICTQLSDLFAARFSLSSTGGQCAALTARFEGGITLLITDFEDSLSPLAWHRDGRTNGFFVGVYRAVVDPDGTYVEFPDQFAYTCSAAAPPTAEAIADLICQALDLAAGRIPHSSNTSPPRNSPDAGDHCWPQT